MGQLAIHLVGDGALLQHDDDMTGPLRHEGDVKVDRSLAGIARRAEVDLVFVDSPAALANLLDERQQRAAEGDEIAQGMPAQHHHRNIEEVLGGHVGVDDLAVRADHHDGVGQRIEHGFGAADGSGRVAASGQAHAATLHAKAAKDSSRRRSVSRRSGAVST